MRVLAFVAFTALTVGACNDSSPARPTPGPATGSSDLVLGESGATAGGRPIVVQMTGEAERPGPGDPDGTGTATITFNAGKGEVCWQLTWANISEPVGAHIHEAPVTDPGPIVIPFDPIASGCAPVERELVREILTAPEEYYVNVHTADFQPGAIRGQLK